MNRIDGFKALTAENTAPAEEHNGLKAKATHAMPASLAFEN